MSDIDPHLAAALEAAKKKLSYKPDLERMRPRIGDLKNPLTDADYCPVCQYPIITGISCGYCAQQKVLERENLNAWIEAIGGRRAWEDYTKARFEVIAYNKRAFEIAVGFDPRSQNLFFHGPRGSGKSHCAAIAKRPLVTGGFRVRTVSMPTVIDEVLAGIKGGSYASLTKEWLATLTLQPVLSIEDLGVEKPSDHVLGFYYKFINQRYLDKRNGMIITSNYSLEELETRWAATDPEGRVPSRLREMSKGCIVSFMGCPDWREK